MEKDSEGWWVEARIMGFGKANIKGANTYGSLCRRVDGRDHVRSDCDCRGYCAD